MLARAAVPRHAGRGRGRRPAADVPRRGRHQRHRCAEPGGPARLPGVPHRLSDAAGDGSGLAGRRRAASGASASGRPGGQPRPGRAAHAVAARVAAAAERGHRTCRRSRSIAASTSSRQDGIVRRSSRIRGQTGCSRTVLKPTADRKSRRQHAPAERAGWGARAGRRPPSRGCRAGAGPWRRPAPGPARAPARHARVTRPRSSAARRRRTPAPSGTRRPGGRGRRGVGDVAHRLPVDVRDPAHAAPLQQGGREPGLLVLGRVAVLLRPPRVHRVPLPERQPRQGSGRSSSRSSVSDRSLTPVHELSRLCIRRPAPRGPHGAAPAGDRFP